MKFLCLSLFLNNKSILIETIKTTIKTDIFIINTSKRLIKSTRYNTQGIINDGIIIPTVPNFTIDEVIFLSAKSSNCSMLKKVKWGL